MRCERRIEIHPISLPSIRRFEKGQPDTSVHHTFQTPVRFRSLGTCEHVFRSGHHRVGQRCSIFVVADFVTYERAAAPRPFRRRLNFIFLDLSTLPINDRVCFERQPNAIDDSAPPAKITLIIRFAYNSHRVFGTVPQGIDAGEMIIII